MPDLVGIFFKKITLSGKELKTFLLKNILVFNLNISPQLEKHNLWTSICDHFLKCALPSNWTAKLEKAPVFLQRPLPHGKTHSSPFSLNLTERNDVELFTSST